MAECRDFFDEPSSASRGSSSFVNKPSPSQHTAEMDEHCLELTLGLGPAFGASCAPQVRPASVPNCLSKQSSGNLAPSIPFIPTSELVQTSLPLKDAPKGLQNLSGEAEAPGLSKQQSGNYALAGTHMLPNFGVQADGGMAAKPLLSSGDSAFPSRDQIWLKLQRNGAVLGQDVQDPHGASSLWDRRAASMHVIIPHKDVGDAKNDRIRRSNSSGVFSLTSRRISSMDSSLEMSPQNNIVFSQKRDQEALEDLRKRKELQAQRREVARKRRRIATEEKHQKKSKQSSIVQGSGSLQSMLFNDKPSLVGTHASESVCPESHCASSEPFEHEGSRNGMEMVQNSHVEEGKQEILFRCTKRDKVDSLAGSVDEIDGSSYSVPSEGGVSMHRYNATCSMSLKDGASNRLSHEHNSGSLSSMIATEFEQSASAGNRFLNTDNEFKYDGSLLNPHPTLAMNGCTAVHTNKDEGGKSGEIDCVESCTIQNNRKILECTPEGGVMGSCALSTAPMPYNPMSIPSFPFMAVQYPYSIAAATSTAIPVQAGFPLPFVVQYPSQLDNTTSSLHGTCPIDSGVTPGLAFQGTLMSKASSASKDCMEESFEDQWKGGCGEKPAFAPLSRTASHVKDGPQSIGGHLESQVTFSASQLSSISSSGSDACNTKSLILERQQSVAFAGRLSSQSSNVQDQSTLGFKQDALTQKVTNTQHEASIIRGGFIVEDKQVRRVNSEEGIVESLPVEHSSTDAFYVQSQSVKRQKSKSVSDLPWVTTTGKGPNGKTINGFLYIVDGRHVRLVCSCHGKHMSPVEFVEHSGSTDLSNPERSIVVCPGPFS